MSQEGDESTDRRSVLKTITGGALTASALAGVASAASSDGSSPTASGSGTQLDEVEKRSECETKYKCEGNCDKDGSYSQLYKKDCYWNPIYKRCDCTDWEATGDCCF